MSPPQGQTFRHAQITGYGKFAPRAARIAAIRDFLNDAGFGRAARWRIQGDASTRSYERLLRDGTTLYPDEFAEAAGRAAGARRQTLQRHRASGRDRDPFIAMARGLRMFGLSAPAIYAADREAGLLVLEDLGNELVVEGDPPAPIEARYEIAADLLAALHAERTPDTIEVETGVKYRVPRYDMDAMLIETELLLDWFLPLLGSAPSDSMRQLHFAVARGADTGHWPRNRPGCCAIIIRPI